MLCNTSYVRRLTGMAREQPVEGPLNLPRAVLAQTEYNQIFKQAGPLIVQVHLPAYWPTGRSGCQGLVEVCSSFLLTTIIEGSLAGHQIYQDMGYVSFLRY